MVYIETQGELGDIVTMAYKEVVSEPVVRETDNSAGFPALLARPMGEQQGG